jgi:hypothetical protein
MAIDFSDLIDDAEGLTEEQIAEIQEEQRLMFQECFCEDCTDPDCVNCPHLDEITKEVIEGRKDAGEDDTVLHIIT